MDTCSVGMVGAGLARLTVLSSLYIGAQSATPEIALSVSGGPQSVHGIEEGKNELSFLPPPPLKKSI